MLPRCGRGETAEAAEGWGRADAHPVRAEDRHDQGGGSGRAGPLDVAPTAGLTRGRTTSEVPVQALGAFGAGL